MYSDAEHSRVYWKPFWKTGRSVSAGPMLREGTGACWTELENVETGLSLSLWKQTRLEGDW